MENNDLIKVIVIGDLLVGKTSFIHRYVNNTFRSEYKSTIGVDFSLKVIPWTDPSQLKLQLWDIAGQERFTFMTRAYYKDAKGCILMFDLSRSESFIKVKKWKEDLDSKARQPDGSRLPCLLVGNKCDLSDRKVSHEEISKACTDLNFSGWTETSAKDGIMVKESLKYLLDLVTGRTCPNKNVAPPENMTDSIKLNQNPEKSEESKCFC